MSVKRQILLPKTVVFSEKAKAPEELLRPKKLQIDLWEPSVTTVSAGGYLVLDFGEEIRASVRILTCNSNAKNVRIRFGESLSEACADIGEKNATNDHAVRDFTTELPRCSDMRFPESGFRFVRIDVPEGETELKSVLADSVIFSQKEIYRYEGKDPEIRRIFETAKRTVDLCAAGEYIWDGIKRDRLVWIGDIHPEMLSMTAMYGKCRVIERSLDLLREDYPLPKWMNTIPNYTFWWVINVSDYYDRCGELPGVKAFAKRQIPYLKGCMDLLETYVSEDGENLLGDFFVDWPTREKPCAEDGSRALLILAVKRAERFLRAFGEPTGTEEILLGRLMKREIRCGNWKQIIGLKWMALGEITDDEKQALLDGGANGMSTFMSYYILAAVASFDREAAIRMMKEYYGGMLSRGATTFFEDFDLRWLEGSGRIDALPKPGEKDLHGDFGQFCYVGFRHSLCHGWSSGVIEFIRNFCD